EEDQFIVWEALRHEYSRHKKYSDANWAFKFESMEKIAKILDNYKPIDMVRASLWIFNDWDSDIEESIENAGGIFSSVEEMRSEKLREIYFTLGLSGVKDL
ncbi:hypothetical protein ACD968_26470, partial [Escherichia coli]